MPPKDRGHAKLLSVIVRGAALRTERAKALGFCFGGRRAIDGQKVTEGRSGPMRRRVQGDNLRRRGSSRGYGFAGADGGLDPEAEIDMPHSTPALLAQTTKNEQSFAEFVGRFAGRNIGRIIELRLVVRPEKLAEMLHAKEQRARRLPLSNLMDA